MLHNIKYQTRLIDLTEVMEDEVKQAIEYNVTHKMDSYWKKHLQHPDAEALIKTDIRKNTHGNTYSGKIEVIVAGKPSLIHESDYDNVVDFIHNSFKHFKEKLS